MGYCMEYLQNYQCPFAYFHFLLKFLVIGIGYPHFWIPWHLYENFENKISRSENCMESHKWTYISLICCFAKWFYAIYHRLPDFGGGAPSPFFSRTWKGLDQLADRNSQGSSCNTPTSRNIFKHGLPTGQCHMFFFQTRPELVSWLEIWQLQIPTNLEVIVRFPVVGFCPSYEGF